MTAAGRLSSGLLSICAGLCLAAGACHRAAPAHVSFHWSITPSPESVGPSRLVLRPIDAAGNPVRGAHLRIDAQMTHPGMAPAISDVREDASGAYVAELDLTMSGDWILLVSGTSADGQQIDERIDLPGVRPR